MEDAWIRTMRSVDLKLKPFDFANAVARAGLTPQGQPVAKAASGGTSFAEAMSSAPPAARRASAADAPRASGSSTEPVAT